MKFTPLPGFKRYEVSGVLIRNVNTKTLVKAEPDGRFRLYDDEDKRVYYELTKTPMKKSEKAAEAPKSPETVSVVEATKTTKAEKTEKKEKTAKKAEKPEKQGKESNAEVEAKHKELAKQYKIGEMVIYTDKKTGKEEKAKLMRIGPPSHEEVKHKLCAYMKDSSGKNFMRFIDKVRPA